MVVNVLCSIAHMKIYFIVRHPTDILCLADLYIFEVLPADSIEQLYLGNIYRNERYVLSKWAIAYSSSERKIDWTDASKHIIFANKASYAPRIPCCKENLCWDGIVKIFAGKGLKFARN